MIDAASSQMIDPAEFNTAGRLSFGDDIRTRTFCLSRHYTSMPVRLANFWFRSIANVEIRPLSGSLTCMGDLLVYGYFLNGWCPKMLAGNTLARLVAAFDETR